MHVMTQEIGSEFWLEEGSNPKAGIGFHPDRFGFVGDGLYCLSGRTAIDLICRDVAESRSLRKAYLPSYCCESMVYPFTNRGIEVVFYDQKPEYRQDVDLLYLTNYFGYASDYDVDVVRQYHDNGTVIVYDRTHSLFGQSDEIVGYADYSFGSFRKWMAVPTGAYLCKKDGAFCVHPDKDCPFVKNRIEAMELKGRYLRDDANVTKDLFFAKFNIFAKKLTEDYVGYKMDGLSLEMLSTYDVENMLKSRKENASLLYAMLKDVGNLEFWDDATDTALLFVPVLCKNKEDRDALRSFLIQHEIYCPVHWPKGPWIQSGSYADRLVDRELSLLCDQRYGEEQMIRIAHTIKEYYK